MIRMTNSIINKNFLTDLNRNLNGMEKYYRQMATGKRLTKLSDDPVGVIHSMQARYKLYNLEQYEKNTYDAKSILAQAETSVTEINNEIKDLLDLNLSSDDLKNADDKKATAEVVKQLMDHIVTVGNTTLGDKYIFGGYNTLSKPFTVDGSGNLLYNGIDMSLPLSDPAWADEKDQYLTFEIGFGLTMDMTVTGMDLFGTGDENLYGICKDLYDSLMNDDGMDVIGTYITKLQNKQSDMLSTAAGYGGKSIRLEYMSSRYELDTINTTELKSRVEDVDEAEAIMNYKMMSSIYQAALSTGAKIIQPTLMDYLR